MPRQHGDGTSALEAHAEGGLGWKCVLAALSVGISPCKLCSRGQASLVVACLLLAYAMIGTS